MITYDVCDENVINRWNRAIRLIMIVTMIMDDSRQALWLAIISRIEIISLFTHIQSIFFYNCDISLNIHTYILNTPSIEIVIWILIFYIDIDMQKVFNFSFLPAWVIIKIISIDYWREKWYNFPSYIWKHHAPKCSRQIFVINGSFSRSKSHIMTENIRRMYKRGV